MYTQKSDDTGSARFLVPGRVISSSKIPYGALSMPINPQDLTGKTEIVNIRVGVNSVGVLCLEESSKSEWCKEVHWLRALRLADDCYNYNVQLKKVASTQSLDKSRQLVLQVVRPIEPGQELLLWFSEDILATLQMVFLTPDNIQGKKSYVCTHCQAIYETPNPLKLHLALKCGRKSITSLWEKLSNSLTEVKDPKTKTFNFRLTPEKWIPLQKNAIDLSNHIEKRIKLETTPIYRPYIGTLGENLQNSAFKPFKKVDNNIAFNSLALRSPDFLVGMNFEAPRCEDQLETLVSSLGRINEGHMCVYCGKTYSRKYGLKIHIRTHTGYKPLKCKFCLRPFGDPSNLNKHVRLHAEGETPYKCELCGKILVRRRDLERHLKSRHNINDVKVEALVSDEDSTNETISVDDESDLKSQ